MRLTIEKKGGTLPFVSPIPPFGIGQLEGYNGVGKSLSVSVLELCAGRRPMMEAQEWIGFCDGIGILEVTAQELEGAKAIKWVLDGKILRDASKDSPADARPELGWFVDVTIDGDPVSDIDAIRHLFDVERVNGDVGLIEQLAITAELEGAKTEVAEERLLGSETLDLVEQKIGDLSLLLDELSVDRILGREKLVSELRKQTEKAKQSLKEAEARAERVEEANQLRVRLEEISASGESLEGEIRELAEQIAEDEATRKGIVRELEAAEAAAAASSDVKKELESATRSYKTASTRLRNISGELAKAEQIAKLEDGDDTAPRRTELEERLKQLEARRMEVDAGPAVIKIIDRAGPPITHAAATELADQPLLSAPSRAPSSWTISDVAKALTQRRDELDAIPASREANQVAAELAAVSAQVTAIGEIEKLRRDREKAEDRLEAAQEKSAKLTEQLDQAASSRLDELRAARKGLDERLSMLGGKRAVAVYRLDAMGPREQRDAFSSRLSQLLKELDTDESGLQNALAEALEATGHKNDLYRESRELERAASGDHERDIAEVRRTLEILAGDPNFAWTKASVPQQSVSLAEQLELIGNLQRAVAHADRRLDKFRQAFPGLRASLAAGADELRGRQARADIELPKVREWLQRDAARWFDDEDFRVALLGEGATDVSVNLRTRLVSWEAQGVQHTKPIEALSSGERAFAFTQARLALLQQLPSVAKNRLIALDEFGAFVSSNRIKQLAKYLQRWRDSHRTDQILIILPANQDYQALARGADGEMAERYLRMADALAAKGWFVEEFLVP